MNIPAPPKLSIAGSANTATSYLDTTMNSTLNTTMASTYSKRENDGALWRGWYEQNGQKSNMDLKKLKAKIGGKIEGRGRDDIGEFTIKGKEEYKGRHTVEYHGNMAGKKITG